MYNILMNNCKLQAVDLSCLPWRKCQATLITFIYYTHYVHVMHIHDLGLATLKQTLQLLLILQ